jgi:outer membrane receptor protein involved in Fe transport
MKKITLLLFAIFTTQFIYLQKNGTITGRVVDEKTGEDLIGVSVMIKGNSKGTATDIDGTFKLEVPPGTYDLQVSYISYQTKIIEKIEVLPGQLTETVHITLAEAVSELGGHTVTATATKGTNTALILEQKNSAVMFDGISSDQMRRSPDRNTADVLKRVSGATIQDNFVIIRGLPDRYNAAFLNGSPLPSSEPDRKAFSFDIFPSALLSDLKVIKTAMPSLSGEFAGGIILVRTKDIPEKNYYSLSLGTSFNFITTFSNFKRATGGNTDFFGLDDGTRQLPTNFPTNQQMVDAANLGQNDQLVGYAKMLKNNFPIQTSMAAPGVNFQYSMGHNINLIPKKLRSTTTNKTELGSVFGLTYNTMQTFREIERNDFENPGGQVVAFVDKQYNINTSWGGIWNLALLVSKANGANNKISLKNMFNVNTNDQVINRGGFLLDQNFQVKSYNMLYTQNTLFATQLNGEHVLPKSKIKFEWGASYNRLSRIIPDYKILEYRRDASDTTLPYQVTFGGSVQSSLASRFFSNQLDNVGAGNFDFSLPFKIGATRHELKVGAYLQYKSREFQGRVFGYTTYGLGGTDMPSIAVSAIDSIFDNRHFSNQGLVIEEVTRKSDGYNYWASVAAGYIQLENAFFENKLRLIWGARLESFHQNLAAYSAADDSPVNVDSTVIDVLPSINIIYSFHPKFNLRLSGSQTVCRPEARELAPFSFYDYSIFALVGGNAKLQRTKITNADLRLEWYPAGGQLISLTGFFKYFQNPIEKVLFTGATNRTFTYINVPDAYAAGVELEYRFTIGSFMKDNKSRFLNDLSFSGNFAYIHSNVNVLDTLSGTQQNRALQGQSPFIVNASVMYNDSKYDFGIALSFNYIGTRIWTVGNFYYPATLENSRPVLDLQLSKSFMKKKLELVLNFRDLIASRAIFFQDTDGNGSYTEGKDYVMINQRLGQQVSFSVGYKF